MTSADFRLGVCVGEMREVSRRMREIIKKSKLRNERIRRLL